MIPLDPTFRKVRKIKVTQSTDRGRIYSSKNVADGYVEFESLGEESLFLLLDHDPNCVAIESQPIEIPNPNQAGTKYIPDAWAKFIDGTQYLYDVKFHTFFEDLSRDPQKEAKWKDRSQIIENFCRIRSLSYKILTDNDLRSERLENILFLRKNKRVPPLLEKVEPIRKEYLAIAGGLPRLKLAQLIAGKIQIDMQEIIPSIDHLIFHDTFTLDFESRITDETILKTKPNDINTCILPLNRYFDKLAAQLKKSPPATKLNITIADPSYNAQTQREFLALPENVQGQILAKINHLKIFENEDFSSSLLQKYLQQHHLAKGTIYRWKKTFEQKGWVGLIPQDEKKGRKKGNNAQLEDLIRKVIEERYLTKIQPSIISSYRFLEIECKKVGITPCHFETFRRRIQELSPDRKVLKRRGRKAYKDEFKSLNGVFPFGKHPLDAIEIDHTVLDIILVTRDHEVPIGRPTITVAIDIFSRMIFGYYLSYDAPSSLSVGMCLYNGLSPKTSLLQKMQAKNQWPICGIPKSIICDNGKEFQGQAFLTFCQQYDIEVISNPVRSPEKKPHIERFFKTLNLAIRDDHVGGYVPPIGDKRITQYNPEKHAVMNFDEFERWFVHWLVDNYHIKPHEGIKEKEGLEISPLVRFQQGIYNSEGRTVGAPTIPANMEQLKFDVLPYYKRQLSRGGISIFGLKYNAEIIGQLIATQLSPKMKYIIRYDPRDIRELYLWVDSTKTYVEIPLKNVYHSQLKVDPKNPLDSPLSLPELNSIKRHRGSWFPVNQSELSEALVTRQKIIEESKTQTRTARAGRKRGEIVQHHRKTSTSARLRETSSEKTQQALKIDNKVDQIKGPYPIETNWGEGDLT